MLHNFLNGKGNLIIECLARMKNSNFRLINICRRWRSKCSIKMPEIHIIKRDMIIWGVFDCSSHLRSSLPPNRLSHRVDGLALYCALRSSPKNSYYKLHSATREEISLSPWRREKSCDFSEKFREPG